MRPSGANKWSHILLTRPAPVTVSLAREMESLTKVLDEFIDNINLVSSQLKDNDVVREEKDGFSIDTFWTRIDGALVVLSREATKLCLAFSSPPFPSAKECEVLVRGLEQSMLVLVSALYSLPASQGRTLLSDVRSTMVSIAASVSLLASVIKLNDPQSCKEHLVATGTVWEYCDRVKHLPKDNKQAVLRKVRESEELVNDALSEVQEALDSPDDCGIGDAMDDADLDEPQWSEEDRKLIAPAVGLVKAAKASLKKTRGAVATRGQCADHLGVDHMDSVGDRLAAISSAVDDLVSGLYPPITHPDHVLSNAEKLVSVIMDLTNFLRDSTLTTETDASWLDFLQHALDHNVIKLKEIVTS